MTLEAGGRDVKTAADGRTTSADLRTGRSD
jgi:hypothetical protein